MGGSAAGGGMGAAPTELGLDKEGNEFLIDGLPKPEIGVEGEQEKWLWATDKTRAEVKQEIIRELMERTGLDYDTVNQQVGLWSKTAANTNIDALQMQMMAGETFDVGVRDSLETRFTEVSEDVAKGWEYPAKTTSAEKAAFLEATYGYTQEKLQAAGFKPGDTITLYRGTTQPASVAGNWQAGDTVKVTGNPLQSWSLGEGTARTFVAKSPKKGGERVGVVLAMNVPIESLFSTARTGIGCLTEGEYVVLVGELGHEALVTEVVTR